MDDHRHHRAGKSGVEQLAAGDDQMLRQFVATRDEQAFRGLVTRHSELVLGVCLRILRDRHDAEEAFQATFLVLAKKAARVRGGRSLGPWLYGVAYRIAIRALERRTRRHMDSLPADIASVEEALEGVWECHWRRALDDALHELPERYREPLVLHYLQGKTNNVVATELGLSVRTVEGRQRRGKALLKRRLALHKVALPLAVSAVAATAAAEASASLVEATVSASVAFVSGTSAAGGEGAARLAQNEVNAMTSSLAPVSASVALIAVIGAAAIGVGGYAVAQGGDSRPLSVAVEAAATDASSTDVDAEVEATAFDPSESTEFAAPLSVTSDGPVDLVRLSDAERHIQAVLDSSPATFDFIEMPLVEAMNVIGDEHGIQVWFDTAALDAVAVSPDVQVTVQLHDLPLKSALRLMLKQVPDLTYLVRDDVLVITTQDEALSTLETHVYDATDVVDAAGVSIEELAELIPNAIVTDSWEVNGSGEGTIAPLGQRFLVINQPQSVHEEVMEFLRQLEAVRGAGDGARQ
jgi:RNA polymerase sigma factor (sigma-70 family)